MLRPRALFADLALFPARTPTLPPATHTNCYGVGGSEVLLVDPATPYEDEGRALLAWVDELRAQGRQVTAIVLTHHHGDHSGGAAFFARALGVPIWAHEITAQRLPDLRVTRHLADGEVLCPAGSLTRGWRLLLTPGHAPGHLCLWDEDRRLAIVGDMVASQGTILVEPVDGDMRVYLQQLERLLLLDLRVILPAHGEPVDDPGELLRRYIAHRLAREAKVLDAVRQGPRSSADELLPVAYADTPKQLWPIALLSLRAHLIKLVDDGVVRSEDGRFQSVDSSNGRDDRVG